MGDLVTTVADPPVPAAGPTVPLAGAADLPGPVAGPVTPPPSFRRGGQAGIWCGLSAAALLAAATVIGAHWYVLLGIALGGVVLTVGRLSGLVRLYIGAVLVQLVVAPWFDDVIPGARDIGRGVAPYVAFWVVVAVVAGTVSAALPIRTVGRSAVRRPGGVEYVPPLVFSTLGLGIQAQLVLSGATGVTAQASGASSGGGYAGLFASVSAIMAGAVLLTTRARGSGRTSAGVVSLVLVIAHMALMVLTGFRGAAPLFLLTLAICAPRSRGPAVPQRTAVLRGGAIALVITLLFIAGASVRSSISGPEATSAGTVQPAIGLGNVLPSVMDRLDLAPSLRAAMDRRNDSDARAATNIDDQISAGIPRFLNPAKKPVDYGSDVAEAFFDLPPGSRSSSTITALGDGIVNSGLAGAGGFILIYLLVLDRVWRRLGRATEVRTVAYRAIIILFAEDTGTPVVLLGINMLRALALAWLLFRFGDALVGRWAQRASRSQAAVAVPRPGSVPAVRRRPDAERIVTSHRARVPSPTPSPAPVMAGATRAGPVEEAAPATEVPDVPPPPAAPHPPRRRRRRTRAGRPIPVDLRKKEEGR